MQHSTRRDALLDLGPQLAGFDLRLPARAIRYYITASVEMGHLCPITMTNACVAALQHEPEVLNAWLPLITRGNTIPARLLRFPSGK